MKNRSILSAFIFLSIFTVAFYLRHFTFWLPHWQGDQSQYVILAMKIDSERALAAYNLSETNTDELKLADPPGTSIATVYRAKGQRGEILDSYYLRAVGYYDMPFFYKAPGFPIALALSHKWLAPRGDPFSVVKSNLGSAVLKYKPGLYWNTQRWAAIIPFTSSLLILILTFWWTHRRFGSPAAHYAAFILAVNPVSILTSNRLWTEDLMTLFLILAMFFYYGGFGRRRLWMCFVSGGLMGLAVLTNQKSLLTIPAIWLFTLLAARTEGQKNIWRVFLDLRWWAFVLALALVTFNWFWTIYKFYGHPLWEPATAVISPTDWDWQRVLLSRPHGIIFYTVGTAAVSWGFLAGYATLIDGVRAAASAWRGAFRSESDKAALFAWCWILPFAVYFLPMRTGEYRYLMPIYPVLAALSGWMLVRFMERLAPFFKRPQYAAVPIWCFLLGGAVYSIHSVFHSLWLQRNLIHAPW